MQPYIVLAERMGAFLAQVSEGSLEEISIRYGGHIAEWKTELIRNGAIKGILNQALEEKANLVNAATIADERGLRVLESHKAKASTGGAGSVLSIFLKTSSEEHIVKGAVLHGEAPRLLHVDGIDVEAPLERNLIFMRNRDVPGVIGKVGSHRGRARRRRSSRCGADATPGNSCRAPGQGRQTFLRICDCRMADETGAVCSNPQKPIGNQYFSFPALRVSACGFRPAVTSSASGSAE